MDESTPKRIPKNSNSQGYDFSITDRLTLTNSSTKQNINSRNQFLSPKEEITSSKSQLSSYRDSNRLNVTPTQDNSTLTTSVDNYEMIQASPTLLNNKNGLTTFLDDNPPLFTSPKNSRYGYYKIEDLEDKRNKKNSLKVTPEKNTSTNRSNLKIDYSEDQYSINQERHYKAYNGGVVNFFDAGDGSAKKIRGSAQNRYQEQYFPQESEETSKFQDYEFCEEKGQEEEIPEFEYDKTYYGNYDQEIPEEFQYEQNGFCHPEEGMDSQEYQNILNKIRHNFMYNFGGGKVLSPVTEQKSMEDKYDSTGYIFHSKISSSLKDFHNNLPSNFPYSSKYSISHDRAHLGSLDQKQALYLLTSLNKQNIDRRMTFDVYDNKREELECDTSVGNKTSRSHNLNKENKPPGSRRMKKKDKVTNINFKKMKCPELSSFGTGEDTIPEEATPIKNYQVEGIGAPGDPSMIGTNTMNSTYEYECDVMTEHSVNRLIGDIMIKKFDGEKKCKSSESKIKTISDKDLIEEIDEEEETSKNKRRRKVPKIHYFGRRKLQPKSSKSGSKEKEDIVWKREYDENHIARNDVENCRDRENQDNNGNDDPKNKQSLESAMNFDLMGHTQNLSRRSSAERKKSKRKINYDYDNSEVRNLRNLESMSPQSSNRLSDFKLKEENANDLAKTIKNGFSQQESAQNRRINFYEDITSNDLRKTTQLYNDVYLAQQDCEIKHTPLKIKNAKNHRVMNFIDCDYRAPRGSNLEKNYTSRSIESPKGTEEIKPVSKPRTPVIKKLFRRRSKSPIKNKPILQTFQLDLKDDESDHAIREMKSPEEVSHRWGEDLNDQETDSLRSSQRYRKTIEKYSYNGKNLDSDKRQNEEIRSQENIQLKPESIKILKNNQELKDEEEMGTPKVQPDFSEENKHKMIKTFRDKNKPLVNDLLNVTTTPRVSKVQINLHKNHGKSKEKGMVRKKSWSNCKVKKPREEHRSEVSSCESNKQLQSGLKHRSVNSTFILHNSQFSSIYMKSRKATPIAEDASSKKQHGPIKSSQIQSELAESIYGKSDLKFKQPSITIAIEDAEEEEEEEYEESRDNEIYSPKEDYEIDVMSRSHSNSSHNYSQRSQPENIFHVKENNQTDLRSRENSIRSIENRGNFSNMLSMERNYPKKKEIIMKEKSLKNSKEKIYTSRKDILGSLFKKNSASRRTNNRYNQGDRDNSVCSRNSYQFQLQSRNVTPVIQSRAIQFPKGDNRHSYVVSKRSITPIRQEINLQKSLKDKFSSVKNYNSSYQNKFFGSQNRQIRYKKFDITTVDSSNYRIAGTKVTNFEIQKSKNKAEIKPLRKSSKVIKRSVTPTPIYSSNASFSNYNTCSKRSSLLPKNSLQLNLRSIQADNNRIVIDSRAKNNNRKSLNVQSGYFKTTHQISNKNLNSRKKLLTNASQGFINISNRSVRRDNVSSSSQLPKKMRRASVAAKIIKRDVRRLHHDKNTISGKIQVKGSVFESAFNIANLRKKKTIPQNITTTTTVVNENVQNLSRRNPVKNFNKENVNLNVAGFNKNPLRSQRSFVQEPLVKKIDFNNPRIWRDDSVEKKKNINFYQKSSRERKKKNILSSRLNFGKVKERGNRDEETKKPYNFYCESRRNYFRRKKVDY